MAPARFRLHRLTFAGGAALVASIIIYFAAIQTHWDSQPRLVELQNVTRGSIRKDRVFVIHALALPVFTNFEEPYEAFGGSRDAVEEEIRRMCSVGALQGPEWCGPSEITSEAAQVDAYFQQQRYWAYVLFPLLFWGGILLVAIGTVKTLRR